MFIGSRGGIEERLVPRAGYALETLAIGALNRASLGRKLKTAFQLPISFLRSAVLLVRARPRLVIGVGGYSSGPVVLVARGIGWLWGARTAILEQNAVPGFTNRVLGRVVHVVCVAFPGIEGAFSAGMARVTGNPVRSTIRPFPSAARDPFTVFIFGGSQGAIGINSLVLEALPFLEDLKPKLRFIHQTGEKDYERVAEGHRAAGTLARVERFIHDMPACYSEASLVVCRAGSSTLAEVAAARRAAVLVPFPFASDNHQEKNARIFQKSGAAMVMLQAKAQGAELASLIRSLVLDPSPISAMEDAVAGFYRPKAADEVLDAVVG